EAVLDEVSHALWQYRFPEEFPDRPPSPEDVKRLGPAIDRVVELVDRQLAALIAAFPSPPNVVVVADHGEGPSSDYPPWTGWHASPGIFLAGGPAIAHRPGALQVSYLDIVPTIL